MDGPFVTILFTDMANSASLFDRHGDEAAEAARRTHFTALRHAVAEHRGREVNSTGDGLMVAFSSAVAAVRCAVDMQRATTGIHGELAVRVGLAAGEPLPDGDDLYGTPVILAGRLCDAAEAAEILASDVVCQVAGHRVAELIQPTGALRLRGIGDRVAVAHVCWREEFGEQPPSTEPALALREIRVVIADDQHLLRTGSRVILDDEPDNQGRRRSARRPQCRRYRAPPATRRRPDGHPHARAQRPAGR